MLRNKEIIWLIIRMSIALVIGGVCSTVYQGLAGMFFFLFGTSVIIDYILFTRKRYQQLKELSAYLRRISGGEYELDIRDNQEGELSILKNDIYKVTTRLAELVWQSKKEKYYLADSLSNISHQLKTPLTSMIIMTDLLNDTKLHQEKREEFARTIRSQLIRIEWLVTSLLKLSKMDAGTIQLKAEPVDVCEVIRKAVEHIAIPMELRGQTFSLLENGKAVFQGDFNWSAEAFANIIKNCMEHTQDGGTIQVEYEENTIYTAVLIADTGSGIEIEDLPHIFERFYKGKNTDKDSVGIGLALSKKIFLMENGRLTVESQLGKGTRFLVKFYKKLV